MIFNLIWRNLIDVTVIDGSIRKISDRKRSLDLCRANHLVKIDEDIFTFSFFFFAYVVVTLNVNDWSCLRRHLRFSLVILSMFYIEMTIFFFRVVSWRDLSVATLQTLDDHILFFRFKCRPTSNRIIKLIFYDVYFLKSNWFLWNRYYGFLIF